MQPPNLGRFIESLAGRYYTAEDVNINTQDIAYMQETTKYVTGTREIGGNPSPYTARGTFMGIKAGIKEKFGADTAEGLDRKSTRLNSSHLKLSRMPSSA